MAEDESVDAVLTFRNVHNWINDGAKNAKIIFEQTYNVLRSGDFLVLLNIERKLIPQSKICINLVM